MRKARAIFQNIYSSEETTEEKENAIRKVIGMETHNSFTKQEFINALDWLLNEHPKHNGWIPCSERLPEDGQWVIFTLDEEVVDNDDVMVGYYDARKNWCVNETYFPNAFRFIAWQPLPQPYQQNEVE